MSDPKAPAALRAAGPFLAALCWELGASPAGPALAALAVIAWSALVASRGARLRLAAAMALVGVTLVASAPALLDSPMRAVLVVGGAFWWFLASRWPDEAGAAPFAAARGARRAASVVLAAAVLVAVGGDAPALPWAIATATSAALATWLALGAVPGGWRSSRALAIVASASAAALLAWWVPPGARALVIALGVAPVSLLVRPPEEPLSPLVAWFIDHPARLIVGTFAALSAVGTVLLALPACGERAPVAPFDAAFTAVSAVCVTGLGVVDTPTAFSSLGEVALLGLIQTGGLGIMTFYSLALRALGQRLGLRHELTVAGAVGVEQESRLFGALGRVLTVTVVGEVAGAAVLFAVFAGREPWGAALWRAVFTSVSAFCNAGFALQSDSLVSYQRDPLVLHTVAALIVAGGLSPVAISAAASRLRGRGAALQVRLVWATTALLLASGCLGFLAFEWSGSLGRLGIVDRVHNAWFQSVTLRTAGFNSVDLEESSPVTRVLMVALMFIGGSPGSTAGGVKTTSVALVVLTVAAAMRGRAQVRVLGRTVPHSAVYRAVAAVTAGLCAVLAALGAFLLTQAVAFDRAVFEVVSALGTVGLTLGVTPQLDPVGRIIIMGCMFVGRVGPLTLFLFLADRRSVSDWKYPEEDVAVG